MPVPPEGEARMVVSLRRWPRGPAIRSAFRPRVIARDDLPVVNSLKTRTDDLSLGPIDPPATMDRLAPGIMLAEGAVAVAVSDAPQSSQVRSSAVPCSTI
jgi:hypothetical protein